MLHHLKLQCILDMEQPDEGHTMSCPAGYVCYQVGKSDGFADAIKAYLCLGGVKHFTNFAMVIDPTDETCCWFSNFFCKVVDPEIITKD